MQPLLLVLTASTLILAALTALGAGFVTLWISQIRARREANKPERRSPTVPRIGGWLRTPRILLHEPSCGGEFEAITSAIQFWTKLGHPLGTIELVLSSRAERGSILFQKRGEGNYGTSFATQIATRRMTDGIDLTTIHPLDHYCSHEEVICGYADGQIDHATINLPKRMPGRNFELVAIHMLGHALGYAHAGSVPTDSGLAPERVRGHVMSALLSEAGWKTEGVQVRKPTL